MSDNYQIFVTIGGGEPRMPKLTIVQILDLAQMWPKIWKQNTKNLCGFFFFNSLVWNKIYLYNIIRYTATQLLCRWLPTVGHQLNSKVPSNNTNVNKCHNCQKISDSFQKRLILVNWRGKRPMLSAAMWRTMSIHKIKKFENKIICLLVRFWNHNHTKINLFHIQKIDFLIFLYESQKSSESKKLFSLQNAQITGLFQTSSNEGVWLIRTCAWLNNAASGFFFERRSNFISHNNVRNTQ